MYWSGDHMNGWGFGLMTVSMVLFWALVIFAVIALVRDMSRIGQSSQPNPVQPQLPPLQAPSPELLLSQRFACGEIDEEEYHRRLAVLRGEHLAGTP